MIKIKQQRQVSAILVPVLIVIAVMLMALFRGNQAGQFVILVVALILVDQARPGRLINHWLVKKLKK
ncbi:hypothetical protein [Lactiplantibacillus daowaiensis]|uniref:Uncharacterized protein n=1 Tax=Lactiplantibacillus daowaiensis TaxID=2559918 RepID=A0ABW1RXJ8_9LACO|nr:hypothetical protein [Lactiplantibacillus daowaiensis]